MPSQGHLRGFESGGVSCERRGREVGCLESTAKGPRPGPTYCGQGSPASQGVVWSAVSSLWGVRVEPSQNCILCIFIQTVISGGDILEVKSGGLNLRHQNFAGRQPKMRV